MKNTLTPGLRARVRARSRGQCEAVLEGRRCTRQAEECHHALFRSRGGNILDRYGEIRHLQDLCKRHHDFAHTGGANGTMLVIPGRVLTDKLTRKPVYTGTDVELSRLYPKDP